MKLDHFNPCMFTIAAAFVPLWGCGSGGSDPDPCDGVTCSFHGTCTVEDDAPHCDCAPGYREEGLACVLEETDGDADSDVDGDADSDVDGDADIDGDGDIDGDIDGDADGDVDGDAGGDADLDGDVDGDVDGDGVEDGSVLECGDGTCDDDETACSCEDDCEVSCGDGCCTHDETPVTCSDDCSSGCGPELLFDDFSGGTLDAYDISTWGDSPGTVAWAVDGGAVRRTGGTGAGGGNGVAVTGEGTWADYVVEADVTPVRHLGGGASHAIVARYQDTERFYWFQIDSFWNLARLAHGDMHWHELLGSTDYGVTMDRTYHLTLEVRGPVVRTYIDDALVFSVLNERTPSGRAGFFASAGETLFDNLRVTACSTCRRVFYDDFEDGVLDGWIDHSLVGYHDLHHNLPIIDGDGVYRHPTDGGSGGGGHHQRLDRPLTGMELIMRARVRGSLVHGQTSIMLAVDDDLVRSEISTEISCAAGYTCMWYPGDSRAEIYSRPAGCGGELLAHAAVPRDEEFHDLQCHRHGDGSWSIVLDGEALPLDTNVPDDTYTSFEFVTTFIDSDRTARALDDIEIIDCN